MINVREQLIITMYEALYKEGYFASNLNAILKKAGTSKGGMYHHFDSKQSLAIAAIEEVLGSFVRDYWEEPIAQTGNSLQTLFDLILRLSNQSLMLEKGIDLKYGSPFSNLIGELAVMDEKIASVLQELFLRWEKSIIKVLLLNKKLLRIDIDINHAAAFILASIEGSYSYAKIHQSDEAFTASMNQLILYIKSLLR